MGLADKREKTVEDFDDTLSPEDEATALRIAERVKKSGTDIASMSVRSRASLLQPDNDVPEQ